MTDKIRVLLTEEEVNARINEIASKINEDYAGRPVHLICILKGGVFFTCELAKRLTVPVSLDFMSVSSYGSGTTTTGAVKINKDLSQDIAGRHVIIVEDILDSGVTLSYLKNYLEVRKPASITLVTLLDKPSRRRADVKADYVGFEVEDAFVVGYGLDYAEEYRNLPYIGVLKSEVYTK